MKKIISTIILILIILTISITTYADNENELELKSEKDTLSKGETITIKLSIKNINVKEGINSIEGKINYDKDIFEKIEMTGENNWSATYNEENGLFVATGDRREEGEIITITLKVKEKIKEKETTIKLTNLATADENYNKLSLQDTSYTFNKKNKKQNKIIKITTIIIILAIIILIIRKKLHKKI